jgi:hypothetical protein
MKSERAIKRRMNVLEETVEYAKEHGYDELARTCLIKLEILKWVLEEK